MLSCSKHHKMNIKTTRRYKYDVKRLFTESDEFKSVKKFFDDCRSPKQLIANLKFENFEIFKVIERNPDKTLNEKDLKRKLLSINLLSTALNMTEWVSI